MTHFSLRYKLIDIKQLHLQTLLLTVQWDNYSGKQFGSKNVHEL